MTNATIKSDLASFLAALEGCRGCEYDEAEGGLFNHCDTCCRKITTAAYALFAPPHRGKLRSALGKFLQDSPTVAELPLEAPYGGHAMQCAQCGAVTVLPYVDAAHTAVLTAPASGWQIDSKHGVQCPTCAPALTAFTAPSIHG